MLTFKKKKSKRLYLKLKALNKCPQKSGTCTKVFFTTPKKPNSALRKLAKIRLSNFKKIIAHIPGETHNLLKFSSVLNRGCRVRDTPGIKYRVIRNAKGYNCKAIVWRTKARSKYGTKRMLVNRFEFLRSRVDRLDHEISIIQKLLTKSQLEFIDSQMEELSKKKN